MKSKNILILGASGFIGSVLLKKIINYGDFEVSVLQRKNNIISKNVKIYTGDIRNFDWNDLEVVPDVIFHLARINSSRFKNFGRFLSAYQGKIANKRILKHFKKYDKRPKIVYLSGSLMYGNSNNAINENNVLNPISFAREYIIAEKPFIKESLKGNFKINIARVPWVVGNESWFKAFYIDYIKKNNKVPVYGKGDNLMTLIDVEDVANALIEFIDVDLPTNVNITSPICLKQKEMCNYLSDRNRMPIQEIDISKYEKAIQEAFESSIQLKSKYTYFEECIKSKSLEQIFAPYLFFKT